MRLLSRLLSDAGTIQRELKILNPPGNLAGIRYGLSDRHAGGETVCLLTFRHGASIIYKPRSMLGEDLFYRVLDVLNDSPQVRFPAGRLRILDRGTYAWCEHVAVGATSSFDEAQRFHYRCGLICASAHLLGVTDCHDGNLIAAGEYPYLVDAETVGHPDPVPFTPGADNLIDLQFHDGVVRTGFCPFWKGTSAGGGGATFQAAALADSRLIDWRSRRLAWSNLQTDGIGAVASHFYSKQSPNRPADETGSPWMLSDFVADVSQGFADGLSAARHNDFRLREIVERRLSQGETRFIFRDTDVYYALLDEAAETAAYENAQVFRDHIGRLRGSTGGTGPRSDILDDEIASVLAGDIPRFTVPVGESDYVLSSGRRIPFPFIQSPRAKVLSRLQKNALGQGPNESEALRKTLDALDLRVTRGTVEDGGWPGRKALGRAEALSTACSIGDRLLGTAVEEGGDVGWLAPVRVPGTDRFNYRPIPDGLYDGKLGIALFLVWLSEASGDPRYADLGLRAIASSRSISPLFALEPVATGATAVDRDGRAAELLFVLAALGRLLDESRYFERALRLVEARMGPIRRPDPGILQGYGGEILARLALHDL
ncbi:DUF4135 domain-containing protein, partial [Methylorubrum thiocyanatum]|uniref:DUF4135 domain-containing protein n=1 Tax=Methylorubrum thiocyanatum TaxID=47958 RepID=UPI0035C82AAE